MREVDSLKFSILINTFNYGRFVAEAVNSALAQTLAPHEIIIVDDGSTDKTREVVASNFGSNPLVQYVYQENRGQLAAFIRGIELSSGDIVCFLDADDLYEETHLANMHAVFVKDKHCGFAFSAHRLFDKRDEVMTYSPTSRCLGYSVLSTRFERNLVGSATSTLAIRRDILAIILPSLIRVVSRWRYRSDDTLVLGASIAGAKKYFLAEPTVLYRVHGSNDFFGRRETYEDSYRHGLLRDTFVEVLCQDLGLGPLVRHQVLSEFLTIEAPSPKEFDTYKRLNALLSRSQWAKLKTSIKIHMRYYSQVRAQRAKSTNPH